MTYAPVNIAAFLREWTDHGGVNLGIIGDAAHAQRSSYHNGWDRAVTRYGTSNMAIVSDRDYTFRHVRDQVKSNAATGADLGRRGGSLKALYTFSGWLVERIKLRAPGTQAIREIIYSDGTYVRRWDNTLRKGYVSLRKNTNGSITTITPGQGDSSHYSHTHISFHRDTGSQNLVQIIKPYFVPVVPATTPTPITGDTVMPALSAYLPGYLVTVKGTSNIRNAPTLVTASVIRVVPATLTEKWTIVGWAKGSVDPESNSDQWAMRWNTGRWEYTAKVNLVGAPVAPVNSAKLTALRALLLDILDD